MTAHAILADLRRRLPGHTLPRAFYVEPEHYRLDLERIWYRDWVFAGHDCELAEQGAWLTLQVGDYPLVLVRGADGVIRGFHNTCRHRGSRVCVGDHGSAPNLTCPYHQWTYALDGSLFYARDMPEGFDPSARGLKPVHVAGVAGYLFVCVAADPPDFAPYAAAAAPYLAPHRIDQAKVAFESTIVENGNWKLVWENNRECYHCGANHPELCRSFPRDPTFVGAEDARNEPKMRALWEHAEALGLPSEFLIAPDAQYRMVRMPLLRDAVSYTMSGRPAVRRGLSDGVTDPRIGALLMFHYPTTWNHALADHALSFRVLPLGPMHTQVTTKWLVHRDAVEGRDYHLDELTKVWLATNDQDRRIVEENQRGVCSPAFEPGPYSMVHESGVAQFVDWYAGAMLRDDDAARLSEAAD